MCNDCAKKKRRRPRTNYDCKTCDNKLEKPSYKPIYCKECVVSRSLKRRRDDPVATLKSRLYNSFRHKTDDDTLWSVKTVEKVWKRCKRKSVISGEANYKHLCITTKTNNRPITEDDLVVVTSIEAMQMAKAKDRVAFFERNKL